MEEKICEILPESHVSLDITSNTKEEALKEMVDLLDSSGSIVDKKKLLDNLLEREKLETTGIGEGIALPHARTDSVSSMLIGFGRSGKGIEYQALDGSPVHIIFIIVAPKTFSTRVLKILAKISRLLNNDDFKKGLLSAKTNKEIQDLIRSRE